MRMGLDPIPQTIKDADTQLIKSLSDKDLALKVEELKRMMGEARPQNDMDIMAFDIAVVMNEIKHRKDHPTPPPTPSPDPMIVPNSDPSNDTTYLILTGVISIGIIGAIFLINYLKRE